MANDTTDVAKQATKTTAPDKLLEGLLNYDPVPAPVISLLIRVMLEFLTCWSVSTRSLAPAGETRRRNARSGRAAELAKALSNLYFAEPAFWATAIHFAGENAGAASGIMNTAGIIGGIISTSLTPVIVKHFGWLPALGSGAAVADIAGANQREQRGCGGDSVEGGQAQSGRRGSGEDVRDREYSRWRRSDHDG